MKIFESKMKNVYYPLLKKSAWHCQNCLSTFSDNLQIIPDEKERYLLELFSGSKTVSTTAEGFKYKTFTVDIEKKYQPDLCTDLTKINLNQIPGQRKVSIIWASIPCTTYSILNLHNHWEKITHSHRKYNYVPKTNEAKKAIQLLEKTIWLIKSINPTFYFIENPRGALRHMPQINFAPIRHEITYSDFGMDIYKPTDIFTNCNFLQLPKIGSCVGKVLPGSVAGMNNAFDRSVVPRRLIQEILTQIDFNLKS
jgi:hypothetical protein